MRSQISRTAALAAMAALVVACAGGGSATPTPPASTPAAASPSSESANPSPSQEAVKLTYFTFSAAPDHLKDLGAIVDAFEAQHPNVTIDVQTDRSTDPPV